jgi:hypothetical protein
MPWTCFSCPADVPPGTSNREAVQSAPPGLRRMHTGSTCFRYPGDVQPSPRRMGLLNCFSYPSDMPPDLRRMPTGTTCFKY